jgi:hypothetical protein
MICSSDGKGILAVLSFLLRFAIRVGSSWQCNCQLLSVDCDGWMDENKRRSERGISSPYIYKFMSEQLAHLSTRVRLMTPAHLYY